MRLLNQLFNKAIKPEKTQPIIIVSGLPRSGTSMMMKILESGGFSIVTDGMRSADEDNPKGYYELEEVKTLVNGIEPSWLIEAEGKVVKVISFLLQYLPRSHRYKVIFMRREISEILTSQAKMLARRNEVSVDSDEKVKDTYLEHLKRVKVWLSNQQNIEVLYIDHRSLLEAPENSIRNLIKFIDCDLPEEKIEAMVSVPDRSLYRNRSI